MSDGANGLYRNPGDGSFTDVTDDVGLSGVAGWGIWFDYDNDSDADLLIGHSAGSAELFENRGADGFVDMSVESGLSAVTNCWLIFTGDYNNDGLFDVYSYGGGSNNYLMRSNGDGTYTDVADAAGVRTTPGAAGVAVYAANWADFDNDGWLDLYVNGGRYGGNAIFRNLGDGTFENVTAGSGVDNTDDTHAVAAGDYDRDGRVDLYEVNFTGHGSSANKLLRNITETSNNWLVVELRGGQANASGIGARVAVTGSATQIREVGAGVRGSESLPVEFGLGSHSTVDVTITWPGGKVQTLDGVAANQYLVVEEAVNAPGLGWRQIADLPGDQHAATVAVVEGYVAMVGGHSPSGPPNYNIMRIYDPSSDSWIAGPSMGVRRYWPGGGVIEYAGQEELYVVGGYSGYAGLSTVERYTDSDWSTPGDGSWETVASISGPRGHRIMTAVVDNNLYAIGGFYNGGAYYDTNEMYDRATNTWIAREPMPVPLQGGLPAVYDGRIYIFGGNNAGGNLTITLIYDPVADQWSYGSDMPHHRFSGSAAFFGDYIYLIANTLGEPNGQIIDVYHPATDTWYSTEDYPGQNWQSPVITQDGDRVYVLGASYTGPEALECWVGSIGAEIRGGKWDDHNGDGVWDVGEPGLEDWTIYVDDDQDGELDPGETSTTTDVNGQYSFTGLEPGTYVVREVLHGGWQQTMPANGVYIVGIASGEERTGNDFGNYLPLDFGDAPDPTYPTLSANDGARHILQTGPFLGAGVDAEADGQPSAFADGDDTDGNDDEDGVVFTSLLVAGEQASVDITASAAGLLDAWIDVNDDGDWADTGEQIFASEPLAAGLNSLCFSVPEAATPGIRTFGRFRLSTAGGLSFDGLADDGEVEDYEVAVANLALVGSHEYADGVIVSIYDIDPSDGVSDPVVAWYLPQFRRGHTDILVNPGRIGDRVLNSIALYGDGLETADLGFAVKANAGLIGFLDRRTGSPSLGFLVSEGPVGVVNLKAGITGANINGGFPMEGCNWLPPDIDRDGDTDDLTAFYSEGHLRSFVARGDVDGDIVPGGNLNALLIFGGDMNGDVVLAGSDLGRVIVRAKYDRAAGDWVGGNVAENIQSADNIGAVVAIGGNITGNVESTRGAIGLIQASALWDRDDRRWVGGAVSGDVEAGAGLRRLFVAGNLTGDITVARYGYLGNVTVRGSILGSSIDLRSADFWTLSVMGDVDNAAILVDGLFRNVRIGGDFYNSNVYAGELRRVWVGGLIYEDGTDGDTNEIHAEEGRFFARDKTKRGWVTPIDPIWFDNVRAGVCYDV